MLFMVIETFAENDMVPTYARLAERGRQVPDGLTYEGSWIAADFSRCFQLMRTDDVSLLQAWVLAWRGTGMRVEIVPVATGDETRAVIAPALGNAP